MDWLVPILAVVPVGIVLGAYIFLAKDVPPYWQSSRLMYAVSHSAYVPATLAILPSLGHWLGDGGRFGLIVFALSVAVIAGCIWSSHHFNGNPQRHDLFDRLNLSLFQRD